MSTHRTNYVLTRTYVVVVRSKYVYFEVRYMKTKKNVVCIRCRAAATYVNASHEGKDENRSAVKVSNRSSRRDVPPVSNIDSPSFSFYFFFSHRSFVPNAECRRQKRYDSRWSPQYL